MLTRDKRCPSMTRVVKDNHPSLEVLVIEDKVVPTTMVVVTTNKIKTMTREEIVVVAPSTIIDMVASEIETIYLQHSLLLI